jgi:FkbM family methyltransferase
MRERRDVPRSFVFSRLLAAAAFIAACAIGSILWRRWSPASVLAVTPPALPPRPLSAAPQPDWPAPPSPAAARRDWPAAHAYLSSAREMDVAAVLAAAQADARALPAGAPAECRAWLSAAALQPTFTSQFGQDATIYYSFLAGKLARGERGFYVDVGANAPRKLSNTWFLDRCLGWRGVCFEADPGLAAALQLSDRTCTVVNKCASDRVAPLRYTASGAVGHIARLGDDPAYLVPCAPLSYLLLEANVSHVDFLSIDIEGNEVNALSNTDWNAMPIQLVLAESAWSNEQLDMLLSDAGFWRVSDLSYVDDLYIRAPRLLHSNPVHAKWRAENWQFIAEVEKQKKRCIKREGALAVSADGTSVIYTNGAGSAVW